MVMTALSHTHTWTCKNVLPLCTPVDGHGSVVTHTLGPVRTSYPLCTPVDAHDSVVTHTLGAAAVVPDLTLAVVLTFVLAVSCNKEQLCVMYSVHTRVWNAECEIYVHDIQKHIMECSGCDV